MVKTKDELFEAIKNKFAEDDSEETISLIVGSVVETNSLSLLSPQAVKAKRSAVTTNTTQIEPMIVFVLIVFFIPFSPLIQQFHQMSYICLHTLVVLL